MKDNLNLDEEPFELLHQLIPTSFELKEQKFKKSKETNLEKDLKEN